MSVGRALRVALGDFYRQSWRLVVLNSALSAFVLAVAATAFYVPAVAVLLLLAGPLAAALMHCALVVVETDELSLADAREGLRLHWRRGLALAVAAAAVVVVGAVAVRTYAHLGHWAWPLAALAFYVLLVLAVLQLWLWPLAVAEREVPLSTVVRDAALALLRRPLASLGLALALLAVNLAGAAAAVLPLLTLTIAYSFLAAAHFALPRQRLKEV